MSLLRAAPAGRAIACLAAGAALLGPASALAHDGNPSYASQIDTVSPQADGLVVEVVNYDDSIRVRNETDAVVVVGGYEDEPYLRISPDGTVEVNTLSPAHYINADRYADAPVPEDADAEAEPRWEVVGDSGQYTWHDHRIHYMSEGTPPQVTDEGAETKIFDWAIPLTLGTGAGSITGTLMWVGEPGGFPVLPFALLAAVLIAAVALVVWVRRRRDPEPGQEAW